MAIVDEVKVALRVSHTALDSEINDLIAAARQDLILSGVTAIKANDDNDASIKHAIFTYCKAHFGWDNPDAERLLQAFDRLKSQLTLSGDYT